LSVTEGICTIEEYAREEKGTRYGVHPDLVAEVNRFVARDGWAFREMYYTVGSQHFGQILDTVRNWLLEFVVTLKREWKPSNPLPERELTKLLVNVNIYNAAEGGAVSLFDHRDQQVRYQYNAAGNINISSVASIEELVTALGKLRAEIDAAKAAGALPEDAALESQYALLQAEKELESGQADTGSVKGFLEKVHAILESAKVSADLVAAVVSAIEAVERLFGG
jgi:hypothetical protein